MILQAFIDDSGAKNQGPLMVVSAVIGPAEVWAEVSDAWDRELRFETEGRIAYFKEDEAVHLTGEFRHWRAESRDRKVQRLSRIVNRPELFGAWFAIDLDSYQSATKFTGKPYADMKRHGGNQPYLFLMPAVMMAAAAAARNRVPDAQKLELILDEHNVFRQDIEYFYKVMLQVVGSIAPNVREIMPSQPFFRDDKEFLPLQAADMVAGHIRRVYLGDPKGMRSVDLSAVKVWPGSKLLSGEDMRKFAQAHTREKIIMTDAPRPARKGTKKR